MLKDYKSLELDKILQQLANETTCADAAARLPPRSSRTRT